MSTATEKPTIGVLKRESRVIQGALQAIRPRVFDNKRPKVLAIGIHEQIAKELPDAHPESIQHFLGYWCNRWPYLKALSKRETHRYHLNGRRGKAITEGQRLRAIDQVEWKKRRQANHPTEAPTP